MCELCDGSGSVEQQGEETGNYFVIIRSDDDDGNLLPYFTVCEFENEDEDEDPIATIPTPDLNYCPWCGEPL